MENTMLYAAAGCFIGTLLSLVLYRYKSNPFLLFLIPMWGMILAVAISKVIHPYPSSLKKEEKLR